MIRAIGEWLWRGDALRRTQATVDPAALASARAASDLLESGTALGIADGTLLAHALLLTEATKRAARTLGVEAPPDKTPLDDPGLRTQLHKYVDDKAIDRAITALRAPNGQTSLPPANAVMELRRVAETLVAFARAHTTSPRQILFQRWLRVGLLGAVVLTAVTLLVMNPWILRDKARGATWTASSAYPFPGNATHGTLGWPPADYFFATNEEDNPWVVVDLGSVESISRMRIVNRRAGSQERAYPLLVEVSTDQQSWRQIAFRETVFPEAWAFSFPQTDARYIRLSLKRRTFFHLNTIHVM
jgi:F5/8 type C domain